MSVCRAWLPLLSFRSDGLGALSGCRLCRATSAFDTAIRLNRLIAILAAQAMSSKVVLVGRRENTVLDAGPGACGQRHSPPDTPPGEALDRPEAGPWNAYTWKRRIK
ncbi:MAG: hypothetical protein JW719_08275 [Pirellulales bacterium]|nr:hypothetical protein [Pirellulales bacterium]